MIEVTAEDKPPRGLWLLLLAVLILSTAVSAWENHVIQAQRVLLNKELEILEQQQGTIKFQKTTLERIEKFCNGQAMERGGHNEL